MKGVVERALILATRRRLTVRTPLAMAPRWARRIRNTQRGQLQRPAHVRRALRQSDTARYGLLLKSQLSGNGFQLNFLDICTNTFVCGSALHYGVIMGNRMESFFAIEIGKIQVE